MSGKYVNALELGSRVWAEHGLHEHGHEKVSVPAQTGGTVAPFGGDLFTVRWDTGQESVHYSSELLSIGNALNLSEFLDGIMVAAVRVRKTLGPRGGDHGSTIFLRNGDMIYCAPYEFKSLLASLEAAGIPVEAEQIQKEKKITDAELENVLRGLAENAKRKK